jgi:hypothetical protein
MSQWCLVALLASVSACAAQTVAPWHKEGADQGKTAQDNAECRASAQQEAVQRYPYGFSSPALGAFGTTMSQQRDDTNRTNTEEAAFNRCMQARGYRR